MAHFSATGEGAVGQPKKYSLRTAGVVLGAGVVLAVALSLVGNSFEAPVNQATRTVSVEEFVRLNTTALEALVPGVVFGPGEPMSPFLEWNTTALTGAVSAAGVAVDPFLEWNTRALPESVARLGSAQSSFLEWNTTLLPEAGYRMGSATDSFLDWNTKVLDYPPAR